VRAPVSIQLDHVWKSFATNRGTWVPMRERFRELRAKGDRVTVLEDISAEVYGGEVFGVVGSNGAGKSTLLKLIAGIYRADEGRIRVAGRLAPLIELGVGFRPDLPAPENILLNGVMIGLSPAEAKRRTDEIIEFAELQDFTDLKLKNFSSGMRGRLGFSVMSHVDADVMLIDEILAVGDKSFRDKCSDVIADMKTRGRTVVLVSHEMGSINRLCDRAMLIKDHRVAHIGASEEVANRYVAVNSERSFAAQAGGGTEGNPEDVAITEFRLDRPGGDGEEPRLPSRELLEIVAKVELRRPLREPYARLILIDAGGRPLFISPPQYLKPGAEFATGEFEISASIENRLASGRYAMVCRVTETVPDPGEDLRFPGRWLTFGVDGPDQPGSIMSIDADVSVSSSDPDAAESVALR